MATTIYAYSSNVNHCTYSLSLTRSGSTVTLRAWGTIYGNGESGDNNNALYAHVCYNVSPANTSGAATYVSSYGTMIGTGQLVVSKPLTSSKIPKSGTAFDVSWSWTNNNAVTLNNCALFFSKGSGSPYDLGSGSAGQAYAFIGKKHSSINNNYIRYYTQNLAVAAGYSACSAPTSVSVSGQKLTNFAKPSDTITVKWSGASGGNNNTITGYQVYYLISSGGTAPTTSNYTGSVYVSSTSGSGSCTFSFKNATRGYKIVAGVVTKGSAGSSWWSGMKTGGGCAINRLPSTPTVTLVNNRTKVKSSGDTVTFQLNKVGTDSDSGQDITCWYADNTSKTNEAKLSSSFTTPKITSAKTYYFWSWDGLEYSENYVSYTINVNTAPKVNSATVTFTDNIRKNQVGFGDYLVPSVTLGATSNKSDSVVIYQWEYGICKGTSFNNSTADWYSLGNGKNLTSNLKLKTGFIPGVCYSFRCKVTETISSGYTEESAYVYVTRDNDMKTPPIPQFTGVYNNNSGLNGHIEYSADNHFYDKIAMFITKDTGTSSIVVTIENNIQGFNFNFSNNEKISLTNLSSAVHNTNYKVTVKLTHVAFNETITTTIRKEGVSNSSYEVSPLEYVYYPDGSDDIIFKINALGDDYAPISIGNNGNISVKIEDTIIDNYLNLISSESSNKQYKLTKSNLNTILDVHNTNPFNVDINSNNSDLNNLSINIICTNVFEQSYVLDASKNLKVKCDYNDFSVSGGTGGLVSGSYLNMCLNGNSIDSDPLINTIIYEKNKIKYNFHYITYNTDDIYYTTYITRSKYPISTNAGLKAAQWDLYPNDTNSTQHFPITGNRDNTKKIQGEHNIEYTAGINLDSNFIYFKINVKRGSNTSADYYFGTANLISQRLVPLDRLVIRGASYDPPYLQWSHETYDSGGGIRHKSGDDYTQTSTDGLISGKFQLQIAQPNTSLNAQSTYLLKKYILLTDINEPADWQTVPTNYYKYDTTTHEYVQLTEVETYIQDTYYRINNNPFGEKYSKVIDEEAPRNWYTNPENYYSYDSINDEFNQFIESPLYVPNVYYELSTYAKENLIWESDIAQINLTSEENNINNKDAIYFVWETTNTYFNIRLVTVFEAGADNISKATKTTYGQNYQIFNLQPTVSYRNNQIGINIKPEHKANYKDSSILMINMAEINHKYIVLYGMVDEVETIHTINVATGEINGFVLNGGNWSNPNEQYDFLSIGLANGQNF